MPILDESVRIIIAVAIYMVFARSSLVKPGNLLLAAVSFAIVYAAYHFAAPSRPTTSFEIAVYNVSTVFVTFMAAVLAGNIGVWISGRFVKKDARAP